MREKSLKLLRGEIAEYIREKLETRPQTQNRPGSLNGENNH
jgi:hypothetical protein